MRNSLTALLLFVCCGAACAQNNDLRLRLQKNILATSAAESEADIAKLLQDRAAQKDTAGEAEFTRRYNMKMQAFNDAPLRARSFAAQWSANDEFPKKSVKQAAGGKFAEIRNTLNTDLSGKKINAKTVGSFRLLAQMWAASGNFEKALSSGKRIAESGEASKSDSLFLLSVSTKADNAVYAEALKSALMSKNASQRDIFFTLAEAQHQLSSREALLQTLITAEYHWRESATSKNYIWLLTWLVEEEQRTNDINSAVTHLNLALEKAAALTDEDLPLKAKVNATSAGLYHFAGAPEKALPYYDSAAAQYKRLFAAEPEIYEADYTVTLSGLAEARKFINDFNGYENLLKAAVGASESVCANYPPGKCFPFAVHRAADFYFQLGQKKMNTDVKIEPAEAYWRMTEKLAEPLYKRDPLLGGPLLCEAYYKIAGCAAALKKDDTAAAIFRKSLLVRRHLFKLQPKRFAKDLATVLVQNANFDAGSKNFREAVNKVQEAESLATQYGEPNMLEELKRFRLHLQKQIK